MSEVLARFVPNRLLTLGLAAGWALFAAAGIGALLAADPAELGDGVIVGRVSLWVVIILCPALALDALVRALRGTPTLIADTEGIRIRSITGYTGPIPWTEIEGFVPEVISKKIWLAIYLRDPRRTLARYSLVTRFLHVRSHDENAPNITFRHIQLGESPVAAAEKLSEILERYGVGGV